MRSERHQLWPRLWLSNFPMQRSSSTAAGRADTAFQCAGCRYMSFQLWSLTVVHEGLAKKTAVLAERPF